MSDINRDIEELSIFGEVVRTYQEIAAIRMRKVKNSVLRNREFLSGLTEVFSRVRISYYEEVKKVLFSRGIVDPYEQEQYMEKMNFEKKNGRDALILISANTGLYGDITLRVFDYFSEHVDERSDVIILGRIGRMLFEQRFPDKKYKYYEVSDGNPDPSVVSEMVRDLNNYENIFAFHGRFKDILEQVPHQTGVSGRKLTLESEEDLRRIYCIFEPSLEEVFEFFETEIKITLFDQAMYESSLSKFTSRMVSLDFAADNIDKRLNKLNIKSSILKHRKEEKEKNTLMASVLCGVK